MFLLEYDNAFRDVNNWLATNVGVQWHIHCQRSWTRSMSLPNYWFSICLLLTVTICGDIRFNNCLITPNEYTVIMPINEFMCRLLWIGWLVRALTQEPTFPAQHFVALEWLGLISAKTTCEKWIVHLLSIPILRRFVLSLIAGSSFYFRSHSLTLFGPCFHAFHQPCNCATLRNFYK